jgi:type I restriction enzyme M protein
VLTNPPFGGKEGKEAQSTFAFKTRATQVLFLQHVMQILEPGGRCGIVVDEGLLYRTTEEAFVKTKRKLLDECDVWCVVSLPSGAFTGAGAGVKTNAVFFTRGRRTERIWYYDLSHIKVGKKNPLTLDRFFDFFQLLDKRGTPEAETEHSWTLDFAARRTKASEEAAPHRREAEAQRENALRLREQAKAYRRAEKVDLAEQLHSAIDAAERLAREALGKAQAIEDAVYDLKAVNPREKRKTDTRTPAELLAAIREKGLEVDAALARFDQLLAAKQSES